MSRVALHHGDCLEVLRTLGDASVDAVVTDPPYGLSFMGKRWDYDVPSVGVWSECLRVLKPGGHLLAFAGTRTQHRMCCRIEDAGFEIRDMIAWVYATGFPKSLDVSKAIDNAGGMSPKMQSLLLRTKRNASGLSREHVARSIGCTTSSVRDWEEGRARAAGGPVEFIVPSAVYRTKLADLLGYSEDERRLIGYSTDRRGDGSVYGVGHSGELRSGGHTDAARRWHGWGTALKPALEPITVARKPLVGTVAENVLTHGTGALNVDGCRVGAEPSRPLVVSNRRNGNGVYRDGLQGSVCAGTTDQGRWPSNLIHDGSEEVLRCFPESNGSGPSRTLKRGDRVDGDGWGMAGEAGHLRDAGTGSAARFFYCPKASKQDRNCGLDGIEIVTVQCSSWENEDQKARLRVDTARSIPRVIGVSGAPCNDVAAWNTFLFGSGTMGQCHKGSRFTIETVTSSTIESRTLSWLMRCGTSGSTAVAKFETASGGSLAESAVTSVPCLTITSEWTVSPRGVERAASPTQWKISGNAGQPCDHPTVKPTDLMRYLCRLVTPPNGVVLDPFMGSGSTGKAAIAEGFRFIGIEREAEYVEIARARIGQPTENLFEVSA